MTGPDAEDIAIVRRASAAGRLNSNVVVIPNVYVREADDAPPEHDVAFRCRVRGAIALRDIVPVGIIEAVTGRHTIRTLEEEDRVNAFGGTLLDRTFALLPEQIAELNADRCIDCNRSRVSVWFEGGRVRRRFVRQCMCQRATRQEGDR
jgi:hypothetical protein